ncbi:MAG: ABC transporter permease, partial [Anaerolineaceae bacterium]
LPWTLFSKALQDASRSLVSSANIISKVYFPRLILPLSSTLAGLVDFLIAFTVLLLMMVFYGIHPTANLWLLPLLILLALVTAIGVSLWLSALNVMYRDVGHMLPFLSQFWMYITPIAYSSSIVPEKWRFIYALNPMTGVVEGFRWSLLGTGEGPGITLLISSCIAVLITISGLFYFRRMERKFADLV